MLRLNSCSPQEYLNIWSNFFMRWKINSSNILIEKQAAAVIRQLEQR